MIINRLRFALSYIPCVVLSLVLNIVADGVGVFLVFPITYIFAKRFENLGMSSWYIVGLLIPIYNIYLICLCFFKKGVTE